MTYFHTQMVLRLITHHSLGCVKLPVQSAGCDPSFLSVEENEANAQVSAAAHLIYSLFVFQGESPQNDFVGFLTLAVN